jgi:hypothetical protein
MEESGSSKPTSRGHQLEVLRSAANDAIRAVVLQAHRMRHGPLVTEAYNDEGFQRQTDARFLIVAVRWLQRCCAAAGELTTDPALHRAVRDFNAPVLHGQAKELRDIWEHFDAYVLGAGTLQRPDRRRAGVGEQRALGVYTWTGRPEELGSLTWAGLTLSFDVAVNEAQRLCAALRQSPLQPDAD